MMGLAIGLFLILSVIIFGSILYVGFTSINTEIVVIDTDVDGGFIDDEGVRLGEYLLSQDSYLGSRRGLIEIVPDRQPGIRRGPIELLPEYAPFQRRGPIEIIPDYNPYLGIRKPPIWLLPI